MKRNGWGLNEMLGFLAIFGFALVLAAILYGHLFEEFPEKTLSKQNVSEDHTNIEISDETDEENTATIDGEESEKTINSDYLVLEHNLSSLAELYVKERNANVVGSVTYIPLSDLNVSEYQEQLEGCSGYVEYQKQENEYKTYLHCNQYETAGYQAKYAS